MPTQTKRMKTHQRRLSGEQGNGDGDLTPEQAAGPQGQAEAHAAAASAGTAAAAAGDGVDSATCIWLPELICRVADFMPCNDVACCLRLVNRAAAAALKGARYTTIRLSERVPHAAFARRWGAPDAARCLTSSQRRQLLALTAAAGEVGNLKLLLNCRWAGALTPALFCAAAAGGHLDACELLRRRGVAWGPWTIAAAAGADRREVVEWLVANGVPQGWDWRAAQAAAKAGHVGLTAGLLPHVRESMRYYKGSFLAAAVEGCPLPALRHFMLQVLEGTPPPAVAAAAAAEAAVAETAETAETTRPDAETDADAAYAQGTREEWLAWGPELRGWDRHVMLAAAAGSGTCDWRHKVAFLERFAGFLPAAPAPAPAAGATTAQQADQGEHGRAGPTGRTAAAGAKRRRQSAGVESDSGSESGSGSGSGSGGRTTSSDDDDGEGGESLEDDEPGADLFRDEAAPLSPAQSPECDVASMNAVRRRGDWRQRLDWLGGRGYRLCPTAACAAAEAGNAEALAYLLGRMDVPPGLVERVIGSSAVRGDLPVLRLLRPYMRDTAAEDAAELAAAHGHAAVVAWLVENEADTRGRPHQHDGDGGSDGDAAAEAEAPQGPGRLMTAALFRAAAKSGSIALLQWLRDRGCAWDSRAWVTAAADSSQEVVEWLAAAGCPMPADGEPYLLPAREGDLGMLRCLRRLGCPLGPPGGGLLTRVLSTHLAPADGGGMRGLRCLVEELGCSVGWEAALRATEQWRGRDQDEVAAWLRQLREEREGRAEALEEEDGGQCGAGACAARRAQRRGSR